VHEYLEIIQTNLIICSSFADIMAADKQLAKEIEFDLRKFEEQQAEIEAQKQVTPAAMVCTSLKYWCTMYFCIRYVGDIQRQKITVRCLMENKLIFWAE
jgi:hypothetical protein